MPYLDYSGGTSLEDLMMRKLGEGQYATATPTISPELSAFGARPEAAKPEPTTGEKVMKGIQDLSPLLSQVGTSLMRGRNTVTGAPTETVGSQIGGAMTSALGTLKMNEALKKMIAQQLSGEGGSVGGGGSFNEGQPMGLTGAETVGLSPEQISGLYSAGINLRAAELKRPFENIKAISESYQHIMTGEAKPAEIALHNATAQKTLAELANWDVKSWQEWQAREAATKKITAEIEEIKAKTETEKGKPAAAVEEIKKTVAETKLKTAEEKKVMAGLDVDQVQALEAAKTAGGAVKISDAGDRLIVTDPKTGREKFSFPIGAKPESAAKTKAEELPMKKFAMQRIAPLVVRQLETEMAAMPGGKQKVDLQNLISSLRGYTGEIDPGVLLAKSSPELQDKFNKLMDIYVKTPGLSETEFGGIVQSILGVKGAPATPEKPTEKRSMFEKFKEIIEPTPTSPDTNAQITKQLTGKPADSYTINFKSGKNVTVYWDGKEIAQKPSSTPQPYGTY
jgi:hypothetical protein